MLLVFAHRASTCCANFDESDDRWTRTLPRRLSTLLFVACGLDYCNCLLAGSPNHMTDRLQRILNAAARLVSGTCEFDRGLSSLLHNDSPGIDVPECINYKLNATVHHCWHQKAPRYLVDCCTPVSEVAGRRLLCSANQHHLTVPCYWLKRCTAGLFSRWSYFVVIYRIISVTQH